MPMVDDMSINLMREMIALSIIEGLTIETDELHHGRKLKRFNRRF